MGIAAAVVGGLFAAKGAIDQRKASKRAAEASRQAAEAQRKSERTQQRIRDVQAARERRAQVAKARQLRADIQSGALAAGTSRTSGAVSGAAQVGTQLGSNLSFLDTVQSLGRQASVFNIQAAGFRTESAIQQGRAASAGAMSGLGMSMFQQAGGFETIQNSGVYQNLFS